MSGPVPFAEVSQAIVDALDGIAFVVEAPVDQPFPGRVVSISDSVRTLLAYAPNAFVENPALTADVLHPDDVLQVTQATERLCRTGTPQRREYRVRHGLTGAYHWFEDSIVLHLSEDGRTVRIVGVARDITDVKVLQGALRRAQERYRRLFDDSLIGSFVCAPTGELVACNAALANLLGYETVEDVSLHDWRSLWLDVSHHARLFDRVRRKGRVDQEVIHLQHRRGHPLCLTLNLVATFDHTGMLTEVHGQLFGDRSVGASLTRAV